MRLEYVTPKKSYDLKSKSIFDDESFLSEAEEIMKITSPKKKQLEITKLFKRLHVEKSYQEEVIDFIQNKGLRNVNHCFDKDGLVIQIPEKKKTIDYYFLKVGPNTRLQDFELAFKLMGEYFKPQIIKRNRKKLYSERDLSIFKMAKSGSTLQNIQDNIFKTFKQKIDETNVRTIVTDVCNMLGIPKKERPKVFGKKIRDK
ncbi:MAG: hypothetical protein KBD55_00735 [Candidatus Pacebacteria bacterium]|nr:hypothetical protein [Candidatus Paceibacterota bacterium]